MRDSDSSFPDVGEQPSFLPRPVPPKPADRNHPGGLIECRRFGIGASSPVVNSLSVVCHRELAFKQS